MIRWFHLEKIFLILEKICYDTFELKKPEMMFC